MSNAYINLPCSSGTANGALTAVSTLARKKTCIVTGITGGVVNIQGTDDAGTNWVTIMSITAPGSYSVDAAFAAMRCSSTGVTGTVTVDLGGTTNLVTDVDLNVPAGNGNGTAGNTSQLGADLTASFAGTFESTVILQGSNDAGTSWADVMAVTAPGDYDFQGPYSRMRVRLQGYVSGTPVVSVGGAVSDAVAPSMVDVADASGMGVLLVDVQALPVGGGGADDVTLYNATFPFAARIVDVIMDVATAGAGGSTVTLRTAAAGAGSALSSALSSAAQGTVRNTVNTMPTVAAGDSIFARRTDSTMVGTIAIYFEKT